MVCDNCRGRGRDFVNEFCRWNSDDGLTIEYLVKMCLKGVMLMDFLYPHTYKFDGYVSRGVCFILYFCTCVQNLTLLSYLYMALLAVNSMFAV